MKKVLNKIVTNLEGVVSLDLRSLGFFRIFLGGIILIDMLDRLKDVNIFYVDNGVGITAPLSRILTNASFTLNNLFPSSTGYQALILIVGAVLAFSLIIGFKTRVTSILLWIILISVQNRNFLILQGGDDYIRVLLFWAIFLPIGYRFSYDYFRNRTQFNKLENRFISPVNIGLLFQVIFLYYFSALSKSSPIWNSDFTAIYYSLSLDTFVTWLGRILLTFRDLLKPLTAFVYYLEREVGILLVFPIFNWIPRTIGILLIVMLHLGIGTTLDVGPFPWIAICGVLSLVPTEAIDLTLKYIKKSRLSNYKFEEFKTFFKRFIPKEIHKPRNNFLQKHNYQIFMIGSILISFFTFTITFISYIWNMNNNGGKIEIPLQISQAFQFIRMDQNWAMFAPYPFTDDGWYVIQGHTISGKIESLFGTPVKTDFNGFPPNYSQDFKNERWRKFMNNLYYEQYKTYRPKLLNYMCREWNEDTSKTDKLESIDMFYMLERTLPDFQTQPIEKLDFGSVKCST